MYSKIENVVFENDRWLFRLLTPQVKSRLNFNIVKVFFISGWNKMALKQQVAQWLFTEMNLAIKCLVNASNFPSLIVKYLNFAAKPNLYLNVNMRVSSVRVFVRTDFVSRNQSSVMFQNWTEELYIFTTYFFKPIYIF